MEYSGCLFDLDGVVFDTEPQYTVFWKKELGFYHPELPGLEQEIKGQTLTQIFEKYFTGSLERERLAVTRHLDDFERNMSFLYIPGFEAFIGRLRAARKKTAIVTSSNRAKMENVYRSHPELVGMMDAILTAEDFERSKPDPDCYLKAAARLGLRPGECVGFEDSFNGLRAVRAAGMCVVGLATTNPADAIRPCCDVVVKDYVGVKF